MHVRLAYGRGGLWVDLPDGVPSALIIEPTLVAAVPDERGAIAAALRDPVSGPSLRERVMPSDTVAVVFSDLTRPMPNDRVLPPLLDELGAAGVPDSQVLLINALGTHRPQTERELGQMLGEDLAGRYRIIQHNAWDDGGLLPVVENWTGRTVRVNRAYLEASVRILTGFIEPHLFAGFSGGPKAVLPGIADIESILDNHGPQMIEAPSATWSVTRGNPVWEEMMSVAQATQPTFLLNVTLDRERRLKGVYAGDLVASHEAGVAHARASAVRHVKGPFDIVVASNSGYPLDLNLYQAVKGMSAAAQIVRQDGDIIVAAECSEGIPEHGEYRRLLWEADSPQELLDRVTAPGFRCHDQWEAQLQAQILLKARVHVHADGLTDEELRRAHVIPCRSIEATIAGILRDRPGATIALLPDGPQTIPVLG